MEYISAHLRFSFPYLFLWLRKKTHKDFYFTFLSQLSQTFLFSTEELYLLDFGQSSYGRVTVDSILSDSTVI